LQFQSITQATKCQSASAQHCMLTSTHTQLPATYDARVADVDPALEAEQRGDLAALAQPHCCHRPAPPTCALPLRVLNSRTQTQSVSQSVHCKNSGDAPRTGRITDRDYFSEFSLRTKHTHRYWKILPPKYVHIATTIQERKKKLYLCIGHKSMLDFSSIEISCDELCIGRQVISRV
jgi:hypothetical protein